MLAMDVHGERGGETGGAPALLIAHGLFGSARNWGAIARRLATDRQVVAVDMRNHGSSPFLPAHGYPDLAADLAGVIDARGGGPMDVLGHSMGGKAAMWLALSRPDLVHRLVVADIAPVAYGHSQSHLIAAMRGLDLSGLTDRRSADAALALRVDDASVRAFLLQSLDLRADPPRWRLNLDVLEAEMGRITGWPGAGAPTLGAQDAGGQAAGGMAPFAGRTLFLAGALSDYVRSEHRATIRALFPQAVQARIPGASHWLHAEKPREFEAAVRVFLS
jgi:esterase